MQAGTPDTSAEVEGLHLDRERRWLSTGDVLQRQGRSHGGDGERVRLGWLGLWACPEQGRQDNALLRLRPGRDWSERAPEASRAGARGSSRGGPARAVAGSGDQAPLCPRRLVVG